MRILRTQEFIDNIEAIKDLNLVTIIIKRLIRVANGNFGDSKSVCGGISEIRIHYGAGWRIYYTMRGRDIVILLCAGNKSDQKRDINKAQELAKEV
ncbi:MAG: type II toxin-antitoxin system RelE/ParE family toxin [Chitinispirillia bacterium]|nr:type II toxin-antitoxin system RelE/ParE family toxin [Chitinispirillia bacterium]